MRGLVLFARSRRWVTVTLLATVAALLVLACGPLSYSLNPRGGYLVTVASQIPLIAAIAIQASLASPLERQEHQAARAMGRLRFLHVVALTLIAAVALGFAATQLQPTTGTARSLDAHIGPVALVRNLLAFTGSALVGSSVVTPRFAWIFPLAWAILPFVALPNPQADQTGLLTLAAQHDDAFGPFATAMIFWIVGTALTTKGIGRSEVHGGQNHRFR